MRPVFRIDQQETDLLLSVAIPGLHWELLGSGNKPWDMKVAYTLAAACERIEQPLPGQYAWYAVHLQWHITPVVYRRDLDNLRIKPILDHLTKNGIWPDDNLRYVQAIYNEAFFVTTQDEECVEVGVYGIRVNP